MLLVRLSCKLYCFNFDSTKLNFVVVGKPIVFSTNNIEKKKEMPKRLHICQKLDFEDHHKA